MFIDYRCLDIAVFGWFILVCILWQFVPILLGCPSRGFPRWSKSYLRRAVQTRLARNPNCQLLPSAEEVVTTARGLWLLTSWRLGRIMGILEMGWKYGAPGVRMIQNGEFVVFLQFFAQIIPDQEHELRVRCSNKPVKQNLCQQEYDFSTEPHHGQVVAAAVL